MTDNLGRAKQTGGGGYKAQRRRYSLLLREPGLAARAAGFFSSRPIALPDQRENIDTPRAFRLTMAAMPMNRPALAESRLSIKPGSIAFFATPWMSA